MDATITGVIIGSFPGVAAAFALWLRSDARLRDARRLEILGHLKTLDEKVSHLENGGGTAKVEKVMATHGVITKDGVFGRRGEPLNPESLPVPGLSDHTIKQIQNTFGRAEQ